MNFNMDDLMTNEEMEQMNNEEEVLEESAMVYNRMLCCQDTNRINELVANVFAPCMSKDAEIPFYESTDDTIQWSTDVMEPTQLVLVEGLLSHRMECGLLEGFFGDYNGSPAKCFPSSAEFLNGTVFLGGIPDDNKYNYTLQNVVRVAGISLDNGNIVKFYEPANPQVPQILNQVMVLCGLDSNDISNLKKAFRVRKTGDKVAKRVQNFNTVTAGLLNTAMDDIVVKEAEMAGRTAGIVAGGVINGAAKGGITLANELVGSINRADYANYGARKELVENCKQLKASLGFKSNKGSATMSW